MRERPFSSTFEPSNSTLRVSGAVDELSEAALREDLATALAGCQGTLVVDLSDVDYFPSVAVSALVDVLRPDDTAAVLVAPEGTVAQRVLEMCGLPHIKA